jgi:ligand-binding SRPBCC domain-containing protein
VEGEVRAWRADAACSCEDGREMLDYLAWAPRAGTQPTRGLIHLHTDVIVPASLEETFDFFSQASNLEQLTPAWLNFRIRTPLPLQMREGLVIEYRILLYGVPIPWTTRIDAWEPGVRFVDRQLRGPYRWWRHEHRFETVTGGTRVVDDVEFLPRLAWLTHGKVRRDVERIFDYRKQALRRSFPP